MSLFSVIETFKSQVLKTSENFQPVSNKNPIGSSISPIKFHFLWFSNYFLNFESNVDNQCHLRVHTQKILTELCSTYNTQQSATFCLGFVFFGVHLVAVLDLSVKSHDHQQVQKLKKRVFQRWLTWMRNPSSAQKNKNMYKYNFMTTEWLANVDHVVWLKASEQLLNSDKSCILLETSWFL